MSKSNMNIFRKIIQTNLRDILNIFSSKEPSYNFIRQVARNNYRLISLNLLSALVQAITEGATLAVIFMAVDDLASGENKAIKSLLSRLLNSYPDLYENIVNIDSNYIFVSLIFIAIGLQFIQAIFKYIHSISTGYFAARCRSLVISKIHRNVLQFDFPCASNYRIGALNDFIRQGEAAIIFEIENLSQISVHFVMILIYFSVIIKLSLWLIIAVFTLLTILATVQNRLLPMLRSNSYQVSEIDAEISSTVTENFQALRLLHTTGMLDDSIERVDSKIGDLENVLKQQSRRISILPSLSSFLPIPVIASIISISVFIFGGKDTSIFPNLVTFILSLQRLNVRLSSIVYSLDSLASNQGRIEKLNKILSKKDKGFRRFGGIIHNKIASKIRFDNVSLDYNKDKKQALTDISFDLNKGKMVALVGPSGAGKSSIVDLLVGLYRPSKGKIYIDDNDLSLIDIVSWQNKLGVVSQDTFLFNASIEDNIAFGSPVRSFSQIEKACKAAQAYEFITSLPQGFQTKVGERGYRLSGGERQRVSLARAILRAPDLLILDEATSSLDSTSEKLVDQAINEFQDSHTILTIAHRLSTVVRADLILVIENGFIVERGNHESLLKNQQLYYELWSSQQT